MTDTREQIRMRLWADAHAANSKEGCGMAIAYADEAIKAFDAKFPIINPLDGLPPHEFGLSIIHNWHKGNPCSVSDAIEKDDSGMWKDSEAKNKALATGELWEMVWRPSSRFASRKIYAPTLNELLELSKA